MISPVRTGGRSSLLGFAFKGPPGGPTSKPRDPLYPAMAESGYSVRSAGCHFIYRAPCQHVASAHSLATASASVRASILKQRNVSVRPPSLVGTLIFTVSWCFGLLAASKAWNGITASTLNQVFLFPHRALLVVALHKAPRQVFTAR